MAGLLGAEPDEIVFTSGGTEADNLALQGVLLAAGPANCHVVTSAIEHPAVLACCRQLERLGVAVSRLPVDDEGLVDPADLEGALRPNTRLVPVMAANNVPGVIQPVAELAESPAATAPCSTPTRCKRWARSRWTFGRCPSICSRSRTQDSRAEGRRGLICPQGG